MLTCASPPVMATGIACRKSVITTGARMTLKDFLTGGSTNWRHGINASMRHNVKIARGPLARWMRKTSKPCRTY